MTECPRLSRPPVGEPGRLRSTVDGMSTMPPWRAARLATGGEVILPPFILYGESLMEYTGGRKKMVSPRAARRTASPRATTARSFC